MDFIESHVVGRCEAYKHGKVFRLPVGTAWVQVGRESEYVLRDRPRARGWLDFDRGLRARPGGHQRRRPGRAVGRQAAGGSEGVLRDRAVTSPTSKSPFSPCSSTWSPAPPVPT